MLTKKTKSRHSLRGGGITTDISSFTAIPGYPIAYWAKTLVEVFSKEKTLADSSIARAGLSTGDNDLYLRLWHEVDEDHIGFNLSSNKEYIDAHKRYVPCNKGGFFRRWYGNNEYIVDWSSSHKFHRPRTTYIDLYYRPAITWTVLTTGKFCARYYGKGFLFDHAAASLFTNETNYPYYLGFMNTRVANYILDMINPTLNTGADVVLKLPIIVGEEYSVVSTKAQENIKLCEKDWDCFETSWAFKKHPLI